MIYNIILDQFIFIVIHPTTLQFIQLLDFLLVDLIINILKVDLSLSKY